MVIERLTPEGVYEPVDASGFLRVTAEDVYRWVAELDSSDQLAWARRVRAEVRLSVVSCQLSVLSVVSSGVSIGRN